jgi:hypothetical protein
VRLGANCLTLLFLHSCEFLSPSFALCCALNHFFFSWDSITIRQTRNHLARDVQYFASKKIIFPDPLAIPSPTSFSQLGFGNPAQRFMVRCIFSPDVSLNMGHYRPFAQGDGLPPGHTTHNVSQSPPSERSYHTRRNLVQL